MAVENWWPVVGWEGIYAVSDKGRVKSLSRLVRSTWRGGLPRIVRLKERILGGSPNGDGHIQVALVDPGTGRRYMRLVHHLVLEAFDGFCPPGLEGCHYDDVGAHNALTNLRWDTRSANQSDRDRNGRARGWYVREMEGVNA